MDAIYLSIGAVLIICLLIVLIFRFLSPRQAYQPGISEVVDKLVNEVKPRFENRAFTRRELSDSLGENVDVAMYYNFKKLLNAGKLTSQNLLASVI